MIRNDLIANASVDTISAVYGESHSSGLGYILRISPFNEHNAADKFYRLDLTAAAYHLNPNKTTITYTNDSQSDPMPYGTRSAFSGKFSIDIGIIQELDTEVIRSFIDKLVSIYYSQDNSQIGEESEFNTGEWGEGIEVTFFDILSLRKGQYVDRTGQIVGDIEGYGINLNYRGMLQFQYNYVEFPGGGLQASQKKSDYFVRIDFFKLCQEFIK